MAALLSVECRAAHSVSYGHNASSSSPSSRNEEMGDFATTKGEMRHVIWAAFNG
jgi:hypothetical protein